MEFKLKIEDLKDFNKVIREPLNITNDREFNSYSHSLKIIKALLNEYNFDESFLESSVVKDYLNKVKPLYLKNYSITRRYQYVQEFLEMVKDHKDFELIKNALGFCISKMVGFSRAYYEIIGYEQINAVEYLTINYWEEDSYGERITSGVYSIPRLRFFTYPDFYAFSVDPNFESQTEFKSLFETFQYYLAETVYYMPKVRVDRHGAYLNTKSLILENNLSYFDSKINNGKSTMKPHKFTKNFLSEKPPVKHPGVILKNFNDKLLSLSSLSRCFITHHYYNETYTNALYYKNLIETYIFNTIFDCIKSSYNVKGPSEYEIYENLRHTPISVVPLQNDSAVVYYTHYAKHNDEYRQEVFRCTIDYRLALNYDPDNTRLEIEPTIKGKEVLHYKVGTHIFNNLYPLYHKVKYQDGVKLSDFTDDNLNYRFSK